MRTRFFFAVLATLATASGAALAQVPPDIASGIRKLGQVSDPPGGTG